MISSGVWTQTQGVQAPFLWITLPPNLGRHGFATRYLLMLRRIL